jgi:Flp pilus assembly protein TadD
LLQQKDLAGAIEDFNRAIELRPTLVTAYEGRGASFMRQARFDLAVKDFTAALKLNPGNPESYANRGLTLIILGREREALSDLQKCVELDPELKTTLETRTELAKKLMRVYTSRSQ